jgi:hypothetical protein
MRTIKLFACLAAACVLSGCDTPTKAYVKQHPELSAEHRKIILSGRIKYGDPVAGMTREQVRLVMGTDPDQFDSLNGEDAWIWFRSKVVRNKMEAENSNGETEKSGGGGKHHANLDTGELTPTESRPGKTTVFFKGDVATHVEFGQGSL